MAFLDPMKFRLDEEGMNSFQDRIAALRAQLPPEVQAMQPPIPGQPLTPVQQVVNPSTTSIQNMTGAQIAQVGRGMSGQPAQPAPTMSDQYRKLDATYPPLGQPGVPAQPQPGMPLTRDSLNQVAGQQPQPGAPPAQQPGQPLTLQQQIQANLQQIAAQAQPKAIQKVMQMAQDLEPPKLIGVDPLNFGRGGIMGTGIEPLDVLAFAVGIGSTWNLPQAQAQQATWEIAGWPKRYKDAQRKSAQEFLQSVSGLANTSIGMSNAQVASANAGRVQQEFDARMQGVDLLHRAGRPAEAFALAGNYVDDFMKLTGGGVPNKIPENLVEGLNGVMSGAMPLASIPPGVLNVLGNPQSQQEASLAAEAWLARHYYGLQPIITPSGEATMRTPRGVLSAQQMPAYIQQVEGQLAQLRAGRGGATPAPMMPAQPPPTLNVPQPPPAAMQAPAAVTPSGQPAAVSGGGITPQAWQAPMPPAPGQTTPTKSPQQWFQGNQSMLPGQAAQVASIFTSPDFRKPIAPEERVKLTSQVALVEYLKSLDKSYAAMVRSYGGPNNPKFQEAKLKQYFIALNARLNEPNVLTIVGTDFARSIAQEVGLPMTPQGAEFTAKYAQAQRFARGALQDTGNIANQERTMFGNMLGQIMDNPLLFHTNMREFQRTLVDAYNQSLASNQLNRTDGFAPLQRPESVVEEIERKKRGGGVQTQQAPAGGLPSGWRVIQPSGGVEY